MDVLTKEEVTRTIPEILHKINEGAVFIHPSDTVYGLGCLATDDAAVQKIRKLKEQTTKPLSVWIPSLEWVTQNCHVTKNVEEALHKLPGPYTLIIDLKNKDAVSSEAILGGATIGIRQPNHWFSAVVEKLGLPIITTSANKTGQSFMTSLDDLDPEIRRVVSFCVYEGKKKARPSTIVHVGKGEVRKR